MMGSFWSQTLVAYVIYNHDYGNIMINIWTAEHTFCICQIIYENDNFVADKFDSLCSIY